MSNAVDPSAPFASGHPDLDEFFAKKPHELKEPGMVARAKALRDVAGEDFVPAGQDSAFTPADNDFSEFTPSYRPDKQSLPKTTASLVDTFEKAGKAIQYGYYSSASGFYNLLANVPGGINRLNDWLVEVTGAGVESKDTVLQNIEDYLRSVSKETSPQALGMEPPKTLENKILAGLAMAPVMVAEYIPGIKALGSAGGFAAVAALENVDEDLDTIAIESAKAAAMGKIVEASAVLKIPERVAALGLLGFGTTDGNLDDKVAAGVTFATLGAMGGQGKVGLKAFDRSFVPKKNKLVEEFDRLTKQKEDINKAIEDPNTPSGLLPALAEAKKDTEFYLGTIADALYTVDKISLRLYGQDLRPMREMSADLVTPEGKLKYKDITPFQREVTGRLQPGKFMEHPVVKWSVDRMSRHRVAIEHNVDRVLHFPKFSETKWGLTGLRSAVAKSTDGGALTAIEKLKTKDANKVLKVLFEVERTPHVTTDVSDSMLAARGLNPEQIKAARGLLHGTKTVLNHYNDMVARYGDGKIEPIKELPNYLPHMFIGSFRVYLKNKKTGNVEYVYPASNVIEAKLIQRKFSKTVGDKYDINSSAVKRYDGEDVAVSAFAEAIKLAEKSTPEAAKLQKLFSDVISKRGFGRHRIQRQGAGGFAGTEGGRKGITEFLKGYAMYVEGGIKAAEAIKVRKEMSDLMLDPNVRKYPNAVNFVQRYVDNALGHQGKITKAIQDITRDYIGERGVQNALGVVNTVTLYSRLLFGNVRFMASQGIQPFQMIPAKLVDLQINGVEGKVIESIIKAQKDFIFPSKEVKSVIKYAMQNRTIEPKFLSEYAGERLFQKGLASIPKKTLDTITLRNASARMEQYSRLNATLMFYHFLRSSGKSQTEATRQSAYLADKYMVEYNNYEGPLIFGEDGLGVIGKPFGLFKTFQHNYLAQMVEHVKTTKRTGDPRGLATFVGGMVLASGLYGVISIKQADTLMEALGKETVTSRLMRSNNPDWVLWGIPSYVSGIDITTTLAAPGLAPTDLVSLPALEYVGKSVAAGFSWAKKAATDTATPKDAERFYREIVPTSMQGYVEKYYQRDEDDIFRDAKKKGRGVLNRNLHDWTARYLSAKSIKESTILKAVYEVSRVEKSAQDSQDTLVATATWLAINGEELPGWLFDRSLDNGFSAQQLISQIKNRIKLQDTTLQNRLNKCSASIKCAKRMDMINNYLDSRLTQYGDKAK